MKRILSVLLVVVMLFGVAPAAFASSESEAFINGLTVDAVISTDAKKVKVIITSDRDYDLMLIPNDLSALPTPVGTKQIKYIDTLKAFAAASAAYKKAVDDFVAAIPEGVSVVDYIKLTYATDIVVNSTVTEADIANLNALNLTAPLVKDNKSICADLVPAFDTQSDSLSSAQASYYFALSECQDDPANTEFLASIHPLWLLKTECVCPFTNGHSNATYSAAFYYSADGTVPIGNDALSKAAAINGTAVSRSFKKDVPMFYIVSISAFTEPISSADIKVVYSDATGMNHEIGAKTVTEVSQPHGIYGLEDNGGFDNEKPLTFNVISENVFVSDHVYDEEAYVAVGWYLDDVKNLKPINYSDNAEITIPANTVDGGYHTVNVVYEHKSFDADGNVVTVEEIESVTIYANSMKFAEVTLLLMKIEAMVESILFKLIEVITGMFN